MRNPLLHKLRIQESVRFNVYTFLGRLGLFLIPINSFPLFPIPTTYRPLWVIPFIALYIYRLLSKKSVRKGEFVLLATIVILLASSTFSYILFDYQRMSGIIKGTVIFALLFLSAGGIGAYFEYLFDRMSKEDALKEIASGIFYSAIFAMSIGFIQLLGMFSSPFSLLSAFITQLFSTRYIGGRVQLVCGEPSWAANYLIFAFIMIRSFYIGKWKKMVLTLMILMFIFCGSTVGYLYALMIVSIHSIIYLNFKTLIRIGTLAFVGLMAGLFVFNLLPVYTQTRITQVLYILQGISSDEILKMAASDRSFRYRLINPFIGLKLGLEYPFFGIGTYGYQYHVVDEYAKLGIDVSDQLGAGSTPKFLLMKVLSEHGVIVFLGVITFIAHLIIKIRRVKSLLFLIFASIVLSFNFDSPLLQTPLLVFMLVLFYPVNYSQPTQYETLYIEK